MLQIDNQSIPVRSTVAQEPVGSFAPYSLQAQEIFLTPEDSLFSSDPPVDRKTAGFVRFPALLALFMVCLCVVFGSFWLAAQHETSIVTSGDTVLKENPAGDSVTKTDKIQEQDENKEAKELLYGDGERVFPVKIHRALMKKDLSYYIEGKNHNIMVINNLVPEYRLIYEPAWVEVFGTVTKDKDYSWIRISGNTSMYQAVQNDKTHKEIMRDWNVVRNHIFDGSRFDNAYIEQFTFINCSFKKASFVSTLFRRVTMQHCDVTGANFLNADFYRLEDEIIGYDGHCDLSTVKGLTLEQIKMTFDCYRRTNLDIHWPPDIEKVLDKEKKQKEQDAKKAASPL